MKRLCSPVTYAKWEGGKNFFFYLERATGMMEEDFVVGYYGTKSSKYVYFSGKEESPKT